MKRLLLFQLVCLFALFVYAYTRTGNTTGFDEGDKQSPLALVERIHTGLIYTLAGSRPIVFNVSLCRVDTDDHINIYGNEMLINNVEAFNGIGFDNYGADRCPHKPAKKAKPQPTETDHDK